MTSLHSPVLERLEKNQTAGLLQDAGLIEQEHGVGLLVRKMALLRCGIQIAKDDVTQQSDAHADAMLMGLRCLWGMAGATMAWGDHNEGHHMWPQAAEHWADLSRYLGRALRLAEYYTETAAHLFPNADGTRDGVPD